MTTVLVTVAIGRVTTSFAHDHDLKVYRDTVCGYYY